MTSSAKTTQKRAGPGRTYATRRLSDTLDGVTRRLFRKQGFAVREVVTRWSDIVGAELAAQSCPEKLVFPAKSGVGGLLHVRVDGPLALELQHLEPLVIERINTYYGFSAVKGLRLVQGPLPKTKKVFRPPPRELSAEEERSLHGLLAPVENDEVRRALEALGRRLMAADPTPPAPGQEIATKIPTDDDS